ncbi:hypothetical protein B9Z55_016095 [Caenorhabditis nigoni]|uniref:Uncharacterized protein n=1 Tax=Caenorhabditis nigoni TaxID=1611254 RepID=A0A2G5UD43_9PELO|nr:hypothetical protein B9Z55_016095 [Caenorhabditis nigoni]
MTAVGGAPREASTMTAVGGAPMGVSSTMTAVGGAPASGSSTMTAVGGAPRGASTMTAASRCNPEKAILFHPKALELRSVDEPPAMQAPDSKENRSAKESGKNRQLGGTWKPLELVFQQLKAFPFEELQRIWRWRRRTSGGGWREENR